MSDYEKISRICYQLSLFNRKGKEEVRFIAERISHLSGVEWVEANGHKRGLAYSDMAIFFRSVKYDAKPYLEALDASMRTRRISKRIRASVITPHHI